VWAPILLVVLRVGQGLAIGGEWGGAVLMAVEHGHKGRRGWYGSWAQIGVPTGLLLATGIFRVFSAMGDDFLFHWGWRICFWFGILLTLFGFFVRQRVSETPLFAENVRTGAVARNPLLDALRQQWRQVGLVIGVRLAENAGYYILSIFVLSYAEGHGLNRNMVLGGDYARLGRRVFYDSAVWRAVGPHWPPPGVPVWRRIVHAGDFSVLRGVSNQATGLDLARAGRRVRDFPRRDVCAAGGVFFRNVRHEGAL
jgi:MFS family permease